ncbi:hypothetical protein PYW07_009862 [Mythimna separata]|uniref:Cytochrome P450 n=1 Tax=Mythimna separata TaxID=271217 RepID=A0AAD7YGF4_MYTSE|nr:hypothetical protein PYW07_009862 [Mythimna separata]
MLVPTFPGKLPIIGHVHKLMKTEKLFQLLISIGEYSLKAGDVTKLYLGPMPVYVVTDPEDVSTVLNKCLEKCFVYKFIEPMVGKMLVAAEVPTWKRNRRILDLCFKQNILDEYLELFNSQASRFVEGLAEDVGKGEVDLTEKIVKSVLETSCRTTLGVRLDGKDLVNDNYIGAVNETLEILSARVCKPWLMSDYIFNKSIYKTKLTKALETIFGLSEHMVQLRKSEHLQRLKKKGGCNSEGRRIQSVIDVVLENTVTETNSLFTDVELRNIADNLLLATYDTTIYEMLFVFICIGSYPDVQEKIYQEITEVLGEDGRLSKENISQLVYLEAAIKESIRLYPIGPIVARDATSDTKLRNVTIPSGSSIMVHLWSVNRNTKYWGFDAEEFKPERWLNTDTVPDHPAAYASFSPGRRGCIGKTYALMYLKATMIPLIRKYKLIADHKNVKLDLKVLMKPVSGHLVEIEERQ